MNITRPMGICFLGMVFSDFLLQSSSFLFLLLLHLSFTVQRAVLLFRFLSISDRSSPAGQVFFFVSFHSPTVNLLPGCSSSSLPFILRPFISCRTVLLLRFLSISDRSSPAGLFSYFVSFHSPTVRLLPGCSSSSIPFILRHSSHVGLFFITAELLQRQ